MTMNGPISQADAVMVGSAATAAARRLAAGRLPEAPLSMPTQIIERQGGLRMQLRFLLAGRQHSAEA